MLALRAVGPCGNEAAVPSNSRLQLVKSAAHLCRFSARISPTALSATFTGHLKRFLHGSPQMCILKYFWLSKTRPDGY